MSSPFPVPPFPCDLRIADDVIGPSLDAHFPCGTPQDGDCGTDRESEHREEHNVQRLGRFAPRVGNYPGVTVEKKIGRVVWNGVHVDLIDLPGTYSLSPRSADELVAVDVLLGRQAGVPTIDVVVCIVDASNLERHLYLLSQVLDTEVPAVLVLNMWDSAVRHGIAIDVALLRERLGIPVVVTEAHHLRGIEDLREAILAAAGRHFSRPTDVFPPSFGAEIECLRDYLASLGQGDEPVYRLERMLLDAGGAIEQQVLSNTSPAVAKYLTEARTRLKDEGYAVPFVEVQSRYRWARSVLKDVVQKPASRPCTWTDRIDRVVTHHVAGLLVFAVLMFLAFQGIYQWAVPLMDLCEAAQSWVSAWVAAHVSPGPLRSLLISGVVAGVGGVLVFLPQIMMLFFFIALLEHCGYMPRVAYMMDRVMSSVGLSGKSFLPLMSSFACAVPGVMATRVVDSPRDRLVTILVAPLMSCSARLPVYLLLIAAFIPARSLLGGWMSLQGLVLFAMMSLGALVAIPIAWLLQRFVLKGDTSAFMLELPEYNLPSLRLLFYRVWEAGQAFVANAGTLIFATTILLWAAGYLPGDHGRLHELEAAIERQSEEADRDEAQLAALRAKRDAESSRLMRESYLGRAGRGIEPLVRPLGWDGNIGVAVLASFPAREVVIATLGTIYSLGGEVDEESSGLIDAIRASRWPDGRPVFNIPVALSIMVFFALCAQCASTLVVIRRETNSWRWPAFSFAYMTALAYIGALITYQAGRVLLGT